MRPRSLLVAFLLVAFSAGVSHGQLPSPVPTNEARAKRFAVVVGQNVSSKPGLDDLEYADDDAIRAHLLFEQAGAQSYLLVSKDAVTQALYPDVQPYGPATRANLERAFAEASVAMNEAHVAELVFFFSGHGNVERGQGVLVLEGGKLTRSDLARLLDESPAEQVHVVIDACRSYYMAYDKAPGGRRKPYRKPFVSFSETGGAERTGFILSTSADRRSHEWERYQSGVFSHEIVSGLRGGADANCDGKITYAEIGAFLETANKGIESPRLRPSYFVRPPGRFPGDMSRVLMSWDGCENAVEVDVEGLGHVYVEDDQGRRVLDLNPDDAHSFMLVLPRRRPMFLRQVGGEHEWVIERDDPVALSSVENHPVSSTRPKGAIERALDKLFVVPFGKDEVHIYLDEFSRVGLWARSLAQARTQPRPAVIMVEKELDRGPETLAIAKWSGVGLAVATGTAAAFFGALADKDAQAAREEVWGSEAWRRKADLAEDKSTASNVLAVVAAAAGVTAVVLFIVDATGDEDAAQDVSGSVPGSFGIRF